MQTISFEALRYPIGNFSFNAIAEAKEINRHISDIENLPAQMRKAVEGLSETQLCTTYRDGGWTLKQVVHHVADSHINAYVRIKLALTESRPTIKPYEESKWADLDDAKNMPVETSLSLLESLHARWAHMLKHLSSEDFVKTVFHPESKRDMSVNFLIQLYAWHGRHHTAHITSLRERKGW